MTRLDILKYQISKSFTLADQESITKEDIEFVLKKATSIVDGYVHYISGPELNYIICDIALDMLYDNLIKSIDTKPMEVPSNVASIKEGDTIITFNQEGSETSTSSKSGLTSDEYYLVSYRDGLDRYRKLAR